MNTQLPYALLVAAVSFVAYLIAPFAKTAWIALPVAVALMLVTLAALKLLLKGAVSEESMPVVFRKFAQNVGNAALSVAIDKMAQGILADGKIDMAESEQLLKLIDGMEGQEEFREALEAARKDGVITLEESASLEKFIWRLAKGRK